MNEASTILIVDDEEVILDVVKEFFNQKGYPALTASNGEAAVKILEKEKVDCCFTDINMPGMNGIELSERIRQIDNTIPVVIMTGYPSLEATLQTIKNGVVDFLIKPVSLNQMEVCLQRVIRERRLFMENILLKRDVKGKKKLARLNQELQTKLNGLNVLNKILSDLNSISNHKDVFGRLVDMTLDIVNSDEARFFVVTEARRPVMVAQSLRKELQSDTAVDIAEDAVTQDQKERELESLIGEVAADQLPMLISKNNGKRLPANVRSCVVVPLMIRQKVFGVLMAAIRHGNHRFSENDLYYLSFLTQHAANSIEKLALYENIYNNLFSTLYAFVKAIEVKDPYTQQHSSRVTDLSLQLGRALGCHQEELDVLNFAGPLHDIGKIGIPDSILLKPGPLTDEEYEKIKEHPELGADIVGKLGMWDHEQEIIRCHHERYDGNGYPAGLKGDEIPLLARILSVADAFDAMASDRAYRKRMDTEKVVGIIRDCAGTQFDPDVVEALLSIHGQGGIGATKA